MQLKKHYFYFTFFIALTNAISAQRDTIIKNNGEIIIAKIIEVGTNGVSYKKADLIDGPSFVIAKEELKVITFSNGGKQEFIKNQSNSNNSIDLSQNKNNKQNGSISTEHKIIFDGKRYYVQGARIGKKDVDRLLGHSDNPAVAIPFKAAKLTKNFQKAASIISYPSTISGGIASVSTFRTVFIEFQNGGAQPGSWINAGLSFIGTLAFPVTSKILKKKRDKLYNKTIDLYNLNKL